MRLEEYLDLTLLNQMVEENKISVRKTGNFRVLDYTRTTIFLKDWNDATIKCRGLIVDNNDVIVGRGFNKFFNYNEVINDIPSELDYEVYEKMDGSLIIAFYAEGKWVCSTRGSLDSYQAKLAENYLKFIKDLLSPKFIYNFELIHPTNSIVVNYGSKEDLVCIAVYDKDTLEEKSLDVVHKFITKVQQHKINLEDILLQDRRNKEGYVLKYSNGFRVKLKHKEYCILHRLKADVTSSNIWKLMCDGHSLEEIQVYFGDEEFWDFIEKEYYKIEEQVQTALDECKEVALNLKGSRKEVAQWVNLNVEESKKAAIFCLIDQNELGAYKNLCKKHKPTTNFSVMQTENGYIYNQLISRMES